LWSSNPKIGDLEKQWHSGWWLTYPSEKYEFVSWDDEIPNIWENKSQVPNHQPALS
jgi:hypothetical protein